RQPRAAVPLDQHGRPQTDPVPRGGRGVAHASSVWVWGASVLRVSRNWRQGCRQNPQAGMPALQPEAWNTISNRSDFVGDDSVDASREQLGGERRFIDRVNPDVQ